MKIKYDSDADAMYISTRKDRIAKTKEIDENTVIDFNKKGQVIGVEILFVKEKNPNILKELKVEKIISA